MVDKAITFEIAQRGCVLIFAFSYAVIFARSVIFWCFSPYLGERALLSTPVPTAGFGWVRPPRSPTRGLRLLRRMSSSRILLSLALIALRAAMVELRRVTVTAWFPPRYFWATYRIARKKAHPGDSNFGV